MLKISDIKEFVIQSAACMEEQECSLMEMIWRSYTIYHGISSEKIDAGFLEVETAISQLSQKRKRRVMRLIGDLCVEHERLAFIEGIRAGSRLVLELGLGERGLDGGE